MQKTGIDLAVKQSTEAINAWKKIAQTIPGAGSLFPFDMITDSLEQFADTQKASVDLILGQNRALADLAKERAASVAEAFENAPALVKQTVEQSIAAQKKALDYSAAQTKAAFNSAKENFGIAGTPAEAVAQSVQRGVDSLIESQKELLDLAAKPFATVN
jgi:leucyl aminopeptidase (aminopeptidase T)